ncbi:MAG: long-chain fatty acid--CoA ligase [Candidatus Binatia bacterium]
MDPCYLAAVLPLYERVLAYIDDAAADRFEDLALAIFVHQFEHNEAYRRYCAQRERTPETVRDWRAIPAVPIIAFKHTALCCGLAVRTFLSSGTTAGPEVRSCHQVADLRLYQRSAVAGLRRFVFPDQARMRLVSLIPPAEEQPHSSLSQMIEWAMESFGAEGSAYAAGAGGLDLERLLDALHASQSDGAPLALLTTTGALIRAIDTLRERRLAFRLPHGSRVMDTGGDKGAPRPLSRAGLLHAVWAAFAVPGYFCVNEYGMAELSSQYYDSVIADRVRGRHAPRRKLAPHWVRPVVLDPETLAAAAPDTPGLLCHFDLANASSAMAVLSEDLAVAAGDGFQLLGRAPQAEERGCSLATAEWGAA